MKLKVLLGKLGKTTEMIGIITFIVCIIIILKYHNMSRLSKLSFLTLASVSIFTCSIGDGIKKISDTVYYMPNCNDFNNPDIVLYHNLKCPSCSSKAKEMSKDNDGNLMCSCGASFKKV